MRGDQAVRPELAGFGSDLADSGAFRKAAPDSPSSFSGALCRLLYELGVRRGFGIIGGANAAFVDALGRSPIRVTQFRHESGAGFAATEFSLAAREPILLFATTGPGLLNALNGVAAARWEGASVVLVTGCTAAVQRGRWGAQETSAFTLPSELFASGPLFDYATVIEDSHQLDVVGMRLALGFSRPNGFVAHVALPMNMQAASAPAAHRPRVEARAATLDRANAAECARVLSTSRFGIWVGHGARRAWRRVRQLVELTGAPVISTPRGKGIVDETHERYLGVSGTGGWEDLGDRVEAAKLDRFLVLGSRLGEGSSFWNAKLVPPKGFVHVDVDPSVPGAAFPSVDTLGVTAEIDSFLCALLEHWPRFDALPAGARSLLSCPGLLRRPAQELVVPRAGLVRPDYLMQRLQELVVGKSDAMIMADAGNAFTWTSQCLRLATPNRYRVSTGYGSMGHMTSGVIGAALASGRKTVAVVGDGSMLMNNELSTAASLGVNAVWIVLNDSRLGMVEQGMRCMGLEPVGCRFPRQDFVAIARGMGCDGERVEAEHELDAAIEHAMDCDGPFVIDVLIDPDVPSPVTRRCQSLLEQLGGAKAK